MENQKMNSTQMMEKTKNKNNMTRGIQFRALEGEGNERRFEVSFSSEEPYERWFGVEILDHSAEAVDLSRLTDIGCVLFNHDRSRPIGRIVSAEISNNRGKAVIEIDEDEESEVIYQKMLKGTLKGASVGYIVKTWEEVSANKKSADGRFTGPCSIAKKWMPYEISIVTIPADATVGVGRQMTQESKRSLDIYERQLLINKNI